MAVCLECKADYIRGITVCPACGRELEPDPPPDPPPSPDFVALMSASFGEASAAMASLEAAGLETRSEDSHHIPGYFAAPLFMTVFVREKDLDAARAALRMPPGAARIPAAPLVRPEQRSAEPEPRSVKPEHLDDEIREAVEAINRKDGVRTKCSCSGAHPGAEEGFITFGPSESGPKGDAKFDQFLAQLQERIQESELVDLIWVDWSPLMGSELRLADSSRAREAWSGLARLVATL